MALKIKRKRRQWAESRGAMLTGSPLHYNMGAASAYEKELDTLIKSMRREYEREINGLLKQLGQQLDATDSYAMDASLASQARILLSFLDRKFQTRFANRSRKLAISFINRVDRAEKASLTDSLRKASGYMTLKVPDMPGDLKDIIKSSAAYNASLISKMQTDYHNRVTSAIMVSIQTGGKGAATIMQELRHIGGMSEKRAHLIATDQTRKITTAMNVERARSMGITQFRWIHSGRPAEPRELHLEYNGQIFDYDNPPIIDRRTGERGFPGQLILCSCVAQPIIDFGKMGAQE